MHAVLILFTLASSLQLANALDLDCTDSPKWVSFLESKPLNAETAYSLWSSTSFEDSRCRLGWICACLVVDIVGGRPWDPPCSAYLTGIPLNLILSSEWPTIELLSHKWSLKWTHERDALGRECDDLEHISLDWKEFKQTIIDALNTGEREKLNQMLSMVNDVSWKAASDAVAPNGELVKDMTNRCFHGVSVSGILRAWGILLSPNGDTQRIAETLLKHYGQAWINHGELALTTDWPVFPVIRLLRRIRYFALNRSHLWRLPIIPANDQVVLILSLTDSTTVEKIMDSYKRLGLWSNLLVVPTSQLAYDACSGVAGVTKCAPFVHSSPFVAKFAALHQLLVVTPRPLISKVLVVMDTVWLFSNPFIHTEPCDLWLGEEPFSRFYSFNFMMFANTVKSRELISIVYQWIQEYPFAVQRGGLSYLLQNRDPLANAPSYSYLPPIDLVPELRIHIINDLATTAGINSLVPVNVFDFGSSEVLKAEVPQSGIITRDALSKYFVGIDSKGGRRFDNEIAGFGSMLTPTRARGSSSVCLESMYKDNLPEGFTDTPANYKVADAEFSESTHITHISFAQGCCATDQRICGKSAIEIGGANSTVALNGTYLDSKYFARNRHIIEFDRTHTMKGKTPSSTTGYYVWKPFVILKKLLDPSIPWNGVVVYTDAGMVFTSSMRPLLEKYMAVSDVVATNTVMMEGHVTKRDVFVSLQADDASVALTNQLASCFIAVRKTSRVIELFRWWLAASGCMDIIGEQDNIHGLPNYEGFRFNNDDQTPFSVLSKKFGYTSISHKEMTTFLEASRNKAKFIAAINSFALKGRVSTAEEYMEAADSKAESLIQPEQV